MIYILNHGLTGNQAIAFYEMKRKLISSEIIVVDSLCHRQFLLIILLISLSK